ncbi:MAG: hypothetical protein NZM42_14000 [Gemmatales bacterium]|nr:hypothetical protein [Gemmatales bacterium]MDW8222909.1 hypothetical protein [Gemmatales bacterium]
MPRGKSIIVWRRARIWGYLAFWACVMGISLADPTLARLGQEGAKAAHAVKLKEVHQFVQKDGDKPERFLSVKFSPDGKRLYATSLAPQARKVYLRAWNLDDRKLAWQQTIATEDKENPMLDSRLKLFQVDVSPGGSYVLVNDWGRVQLWAGRNLVSKGLHDKEVVIHREGELAFELKVEVPAINERHIGWVSAARFLQSDGIQLLAAFGSPPRLRHWWQISSLSLPPRPGFMNELDAKKESQTAAEFSGLLKGSRVTCLAPHPTDSHLVGLAGGNLIWIWNWKTAKVERRWEIYDHTKPLTEKGSFIAYEGVGQVVRVYDLEGTFSSGELRWVSAHGDNGAPFAPSGRIPTWNVNVGGNLPWQSEGFVEIWNREGKKLHRCVHQGAVVSVACAKTAPWLVSAEFRKQVKLVAIDQTPGPPERPVILEYLDLPSCIYVWDLDGKLLALGEGHQAGITDVAIAPSDDLIASCGIGGTVRLWEAPKPR